MIYDLKSLISLNWDCEALAELIPAYSIGATDADETYQVEAGLDACPELRPLLMSYLDVSDVLAGDVPQVEPPARLRDNLMAAIQTPAEPTPAPTPKIIPWRMGLLAAVAALLVVSNIWWMTRFNALERQVEVLTAQQFTADAEWVAFTPLTDDTASVVLLWNPETGTATLYADGLPTLESDQSYQVWLRRGDVDRVSAGVFQQDADGRSVLTFEIPEPLDTFTGIGITAEPFGGSLEPTTSSVAPGATFIIWIHSPRVTSPTLTGNVSPTWLQVTPLTRQQS